MPLKSKSMHQVLNILIGAARSKFAKHGVSAVLYMCLNFFNLFFPMALTSELVYSSWEKAQFL